MSLRSVIAQRLFQKPPEGILAQMLRTVPQAMAFFSIYECPCRGNIFGVNVARAAECSCLAQAFNSVFFGGLLRPVVFVAFFVTVVL